MKPSLTGPVPWARAELHEAEVAQISRQCNAGGSGALHDRPSVRLQLSGRRFGMGQMVPRF